VFQPPTLFGAAVPPALTGSFGLSVSFALVTSVGKNAVRAFSAAAAATSAWY